MTLEIVESLKFHLRDHAMSFRFGEEVSSVESAGRGTITTLASGKKIAAEVVMHSAGRKGNRCSTSTWPGCMPTNAAGWWSTSCTRPRCPTSMPSAMSSFPALAATSMDQGRLAAANAFGEPANELQALQPIGHLHHSRDLVLRKDRGRTDP